MTEETSITLQTVISEFKNISPEVTKAFIFKKDGEILASIEGNVEEEHAKKIADSFDEIASQAAVIGGLELVAVQGVSTQLEISSTNNSYLATVASRAADEKMVKALTRIIVPTVIKLLDQVNPSPSNQPSDAAKLAVNEAEDAVKPPEEPTRMGHTRRCIHAKFRAGSSEAACEPVYGGENRGSTGRLRCRAG